jgi:o-succinylbenzoate---CoA ligase
MKELSRFPCPLAAAARSSPDAVAVRAGDHRWTYRAWDGHVRAATRRLSASGVSRGTRVPIVSRNSPQYLTVLVALWRLGAVPCPLNTRWPPERLRAAIQGLCSRAREARVFVGEGVDVGGLPCSRMEEYEYEHPPSPEASAGQAEYERDQRATIYFTSGSSGEPKAVLHRIENHYANAEASNRNIPYGPGDCWLLSLPLYHVAGMGILWRTLLARATMAIPAPEEDLEAALARYKVTHVSLVTTQLYRLLQPAIGTGGTATRASAWGCVPAGNLKAILLGGSPVPPSLIEQAIALDLPLYKTYGLTEAASQVATTRPEDPPQALYTSGRPLLPDSVRIGDDGHILIRGATRFDGYVRGDVVARPFDHAGWFDTGDRGGWTDEGYLRVLGRADNMFISGGENVQPEEVERELCGIKNIEEAIVVPVPEAEFGQRGVAFLRTAAALDEAALCQALRARLPAYMLPTRFYSWPEHLTDADAKISRHALQQYALMLR